MPLDTLVLPGRLAAGPTAESSPRTNTAAFGDGYSQRSEDGLNTEARTFSGQCVSMSPATCAALLTFFRTHTSKPFLWALPLAPQPRKWIAAKWSENFTTTNRWSVLFTLTEVFDL